MSETRAILACEVPSLFPSMDEMGKDLRIGSMLLAVLPHVPALTAALMGLVGVRGLGRRQQVQSFVKVHLAKTDGCGVEFRADGALILSNTSSSWSALIDMSGGSAASAHECAAAGNGFDAVIRIGNRFIDPVASQGGVPVHSLSFAQIRLAIDMLIREGGVTAPEQVLFLSELFRLFEHPSTAVEGFAQMSSSWKLVTSLEAGQHDLDEHRAALAEAHADWTALVSDVAINLSRYIGAPAELRTDRRISKPGAHELVAQIGVHGLASSITLRVNLLARTISAGMQTPAPQDSRTSAQRISWLLKMIDTGRDDLLVRLRWTDGAVSDHRLADLRDTFAVSAPNGEGLPEHFEILLEELPGKRFSHRSGFVEAISTLVPDFYDAVAQNLIPWRALPPKPVRARIGQAVPAGLPEARSIQRAPRAARQAAAVAPEADPAQSPVASPVASTGEQAATPEVSPALVPGHEPAVEPAVEADTDGPIGHEDDPGEMGADLEADPAAGDAPPHATNDVGSDPVPEADRDAPEDPAGHPAGTPGVDPDAAQIDLAALSDQPLPDEDAEGEPLGMASDPALELPAGAASDVSGALAPEARIDEATIDDLLNDIVAD